MRDFGHTPSGRIFAGDECLLNACSCFCDCFARSNEDFRGVASCPRSSAHKAWLGCHIHCCQGQVKFRVAHEAWLSQRRDMVWWSNSHTGSWPWCCNPPIPPSMYASSRSLQASTFVMRSRSGRVGANRMNRTGCWFMRCSCRMKQSLYTDVGGHMHSSSSRVHVWLWLCLVVELLLQPQAWPKAIVPGGSHAKQIPWRSVKKCSVRFPFSFPRGGS